MQELIVRCEACGEMILQPYDESKVQRCPGCGRVTSLRIVDLADRPDVLRHLRPPRRTPRARTPKDIDI